MPFTRVVLSVINRLWCGSAWQGTYDRRGTGVGHGFLVSNVDAVYEGGTQHHDLFMLWRSPEEFLDLMSHILWGSSRIHRFIVGSASLGA